MGLVAQGPAVPPPADGPAILEIPAPDSADSPGPYKIPDPPAEGAQLQPSESAPAPISLDAGNLFNEYSLRGDTPMIRTWKLLGYPAILAAALTTPPSLGADDNGKQNSDTKSKVTLEDVNESLKGVQKKLGEYMLNTSIMGEEVRILKEKVAQLQRDVDGLRSRATSSNYQPIAPAPSAGAATGTSAGASTATGRIHLVNTWPERITVFLNDRSFPIEPNHEITVADVPSGQFTYMILSQRPDNSILQIAQKSPRTLAANETFTIHVHPH
jgi:hypothetical protein